MEYSNNLNFIELTDNDLTEINGGNIVEDVIWLIKNAKKILS